MLDLYGIHLIFIPYYGRANRLSIVQFASLVTDKPSGLAVHVLTFLWAAYLVGTLVAVMLGVRALSQNDKPSSAPLNDAAAANGLAAAGGYFKSNSLFDAMGD